MTKLISVPGLAAAALLGAAVAAAARLFGPGNVIRKVATELVAGLGGTILVLAVFGLLLGTGLERLLREAPGGEALAQSVGRLEGLLQGPGAQDLRQQERGFGDKPDRIERDVRPLVDGEVPASSKEAAGLRGLLADLQHKRGD